ncbi:ribonuclease P protein component [Pseudostreptobacillus hongkongensis]|uniref:ribonuclease P protein component n=1 Tax=Pseudostreptobacillus hongkongensis TaxID=1162717 RepID=UPI0028D1BDAE|nr:ribonuclease P protein component [Pseudostreptobacillus hongkongensis]
MNKLRKNKEFNRVYNRGKRINGKYILLFEYRSNEQKFGVVASKKAGNSVYRSRAKRLMREAIRLNLESFKPNFEYILVIKSIFKDKFDEIKYIDIEKDLLNILRRNRNEKNSNISN